jgi:hypothetical protein
MKILEQQKLDKDDLDACDICMDEGLQEPNAEYVVKLQFFEHHRFNLWICLCKYHLKKLTEFLR